MRPSKTVTLKKKLKRPIDKDSAAEMALGLDATPHTDVAYRTPSYLSYDSAARQLASTKQVLGPVSSRVLGRTIDFFLYRAVAALHTNTTYVLRGICEVAVIAMNNRRRRFSKHLKRDKALDGMFSFIVQSALGPPRSTLTDKNQDRPLEDVLYSPSLATLTQVNLDQAYLRALLDFFFLNLFKPYSTHLMNVLDSSEASPVSLGKLGSIESYLGANRHTLYSSCQLAETNFKNYVLLITQIGVKYYKSSFALAANTVNRRETAELSELYRLFMLAITRSLDRYDHSQGTFTKWKDLYLTDTRVKNTFLYDRGQLFNVNTSSLASKAKTEDNPEGKLSGFRSTFAVAFDQDKVDLIEDESDYTSPLDVISRASEAEYVFKVLEDVPGLRLAKLFLGAAPSARHTRNC